MILDSNINIYSAMPANNQLRGFISGGNFYCSRISHLEVLGYHKIGTDDQLYFEKFFNLVSMIEIDKDIIEKAVELRQSTRLSVGDSIIAASSLFYELPLITNNEKDFKNVKDISIINPFRL